MNQREDEQAKRTVRACAACGSATVIGMELRVPVPGTTQHRSVRVPWCASEDCAVRMAMDPAQFVEGVR